MQLPKLFSYISNVTNYITSEEKNRKNASKKKSHLILGKTLRKRVIVSVIYIMRKRCGNNNHNFRKISRLDFLNFNVFAFSAAVAFIKYVIRYGVNRDLTIA